jgi:hypothetical protein
MRGLRSRVAPIYHQIKDIDLKSWVVEGSLDGTIESAGLLNVSSSCLVRPCKICQPESVISCDWLWSLASRTN